MSIKANKNRDTWASVEFIVNEIGESGDIENVAGAYETKKEAIEAASRLHEFPSIVIEKVTRKYPFGRGEDKFETVYTSGDIEALKSGGWIDEEEGG
jgi:hypothetical protein